MSEPIKTDAAATEGCAAVTGYAVIGHRKNPRTGKDETFRTPVSEDKWYQVTAADVLLAAMKKNHPTWEWSLQHRPA